MIEIISKALSDIVPYEKNPRKISQAAIDAVAESIQEFGFKNPILIDKHNVIIAGHTRRLAAQKLGLERVPCVVVDDLTPQQIKALRLADNKTNELAKWDFGELDKELADLLDMDMERFGFDLENHEEEEEDDAGMIGSGHHFCIIIDCETESDMNETYDRLRDMGIECRKSKRGN